MSLIEKKCVVCGKEFKVYPYRSITAKFCSYSCAGKNKENKVSRVCRHCGKEFVIKKSQFKYYKGAGRYCSRQCAYDGMVENTRSKPVKDKYGRSRRRDDLLWQRAVRERDGYICKRCGRYDEYIHTHHIILRSRSRKLIHDVDNGVCLCNSCHTWVHHHPKQATEEGYMRRVPVESNSK